METQTRQQAIINRAQTISKRDYVISNVNRNDDRTLELSFSSEELIYMPEYDMYEILDHSTNSIDLSRLRNNAPLLWMHDANNQIGAIKNAYVSEDKRGKALVRFSRRSEAENIYQDVLDGIINNVSVGYKVNKMQYERDNEDGIPIYRAVSWTPLEISIVSLAKDDSVGIGRNLKLQEEEKNMPQENMTQTDEPVVETRANIEEKKAPAIDLESVKDRARKEEQVRIREISAIGEQFKQSELAQRFIREGRSLDEFRAEVLKGIKMQPVVNPVPADELGMSDGEVKGYSLVRAIRGLISGNMEKIAPFEKRCSDEIAKKLGKEARGFYMPHDIKKRDLTVGSSAGGGYTVATDLLASSFIELLRNKMVVRKLGATILSGLQGNVAIPKQSGGATAYWVAESNAPTESQQTFDQVTLTPKTVGAYTDMSRKLIIQSSIDIESFVRNDLATILALAIDKAAINGSGSGAEPTGILNTSGIGNVGTSPAAPTFANMIELWSDVAAENADIGALAFLTNPLVCAKLMQVFTNATYGEIPVWQGGPGDGSMLGYKAMVSNQVPSNLGSSTGATTGVLVLSAIIFGNWADLLIGEWSGTDILVDPYTNSTSGTVRIVALQDVDIAVRHAESFSAMKEVDPA